MSTTVRRCRHCDKDIALSAFAAHVQHHVQVQARCVSEARVYGTFYRSPPREPAKPNPNTQSTEESQRPIQQRSSSRFGMYPCQFCPASFATLQQSRHHQSSGDCPANNIVFWVLVYDSSQPRCYRIEERHEPCRTEKWLFKCRKCDLVYATEDDLRLHAKMHTFNHTVCEHCQKEFQSDYELQVHYEWHRDVQMEYDYEEYPPHDHAIQITPPAKHPLRTMIKPRQDGEVVALSFVSGEDLISPFTARETGKFREMNEAGGFPLWDPFAGGENAPSGPVKISPQALKKRVDIMLEYLRPAPSKRSLDEFLDSVDGRLLKDRFTDPSYRKWLTDTVPESHILFIDGPHCCGKSTLAARVVTDLHGSAFAQQVGITYFFFDNRVENMRTTSSFVRTLIAQLFIQRPELYSRVHLPCRPLLAGVPDDHLLQALASLLSHFPLTFLIIDGLEMADNATEVVEKVNALIHAPWVHLKLLITAHQDSTFPGSFSTSIVHRSKIQILPNEVEENMRSYVKFFLGQQSQILRLRAKRYVDQLVRESDHNFFCLKNSLEWLKSASALRSLKPPLRQADGPFAEKLSILQSHPQPLVQTSVSILQVLRALAEPPSVTCIKTVLKGSNVEHAINHCLQGIVEVKGDILRFSSPQICGYLTAETTSLATANDSQGVPLKINVIEGHATIALSALECMCSSQFNEVIQDLVDNGEVALNRPESFLALNWRRHVVRSSRNAVLLGSLVNFFISEQCHKWYTEMSRLIPVSAVKDLFDLELWQWLNRSRAEAHGVDMSVAVPLLENLRTLVLQQITTTKPPEISVLLSLTTSLAYVYADKGYYSTAESLLRNNLTIAEKWCPEDNRKRLPLYVFGHTIEKGQLVTGRDRLGREKAFGFIALAEIISNLYFRQSSKTLLLKYLRDPRRVNELDHGLPWHFLWDNTDCPSDSTLALMIILRRQGKSDEASVIAARENFQYEEEQGAIVLCCCAGAPDPDHPREAMKAKIEGLPKEPASITAIENLGRFHLPEEPPYKIMVSQLYYEEALERRKATEGLHSPAAFKTMEALTRIYLLHNDAGKLHEMFLNFGAPSVPQLRQLKPSIPRARLNYALLLLTSGLGELAGEILEELTKGQYDEQATGDGKVTGKALINLAALRISQGNNEAAEGLLRSVINDPRGLSSKELAAAKANLSTVLSRTGREDVSEQLRLENRIWTEGVEVTNACPDPLFGAGSGPANGVTGVGFYLL